MFIPSLQKRFLYSSAYDNHQFFFFCQLSNKSHLNQPHKIRTSGEGWLHLVSIGRCQKYYNKKGLRNWLLWSCPIIQVLVQCACCMLRTFSNGTKHYILEYLANGLQMQMTTINSCFCSRSKNYNNSYFCCSLFRINLLYHIYWQQKKLDILAKKNFYIIFFFCFTNHNVWDMLIVSCVTKIHKTEKV